MSDKKKRAKKKAKKDKKEPGIKAITKEFEEEILSHKYDDDAKVLVTVTANFVDSKHEGVTHVTYVLRNNLMDMWVRFADKDSDIHSWRQEVSNIAPVRAAAEAHLDATKWRLFQTEGGKRRKKDITPANRERLRCAVRYYYDLMKLRIAAGNRDSDQAEPAVLEDEDKDFLGQQSVGINALEKACLAEIRDILKESPIYMQWIKNQTGVEATLGGVMVSEIDIGGYRKAAINKRLVEIHCGLEKEGIKDELHLDLTAELQKLEERFKNLKECDTPSALWAYAGLSVNTETHKAIRREKGVKSNWNPFLKAKMVFVLSGCLLRSAATTGDTTWSHLYYDYRHRKESEMVETCHLCEGLGGLKIVDKKQVPTEYTGERGSKVKKCYNCFNKRHNVPWGRGDAHRDMASKRYMVKQFLQELWLKWRELEGLPVTLSYAEAKLGIKHGDHASVAQEPVRQQQADPLEETKTTKRVEAADKPDMNKPGREKKSA